MRYTLKPLNSDSKRYVAPKVFPAELNGCSASSDGSVTMALTLCDPRTAAGEGYRLNLTMTAEDANQMAALLGRLHAMMAPEYQAEFDRVSRREYARKIGQCTSQHGHYDCGKPSDHDHDHATADGLTSWPRTIGEML